MTERPDPSPENNPLWRALGVTPEFEDETNAPVVDTDKLRLYHRDELNESERTEVRLLAGRFRSWYEAFFDVYKDGRSANH